MTLYIHYRKVVHGLQTLTLEILICFDDQSNQIELPSLLARHLLLPVDAVQLPLYGPDGVVDLPQFLLAGEDSLLLLVLLYEVTGNEKRYLQHLQHPATHLMYSALSSSKLFPPCRVLLFLSA